MESTANFNRILLPLGIENEFFEVTSGTLRPESGPLNFAYRLDTRGLSFLLEEFISQGALGLALDSHSGFTKDLHDVSPVLRKRVKAIDREGRIEQQVITVLRPVAEELGIDLAEMGGVYLHTWIGPQMEAIVREEERRRQALLESLFVLHSNCYHLLLGVKHGLQIDIDLPRTWSSIRRLRSGCRSGAARANLAFLQGLCGSYDIELVGCLRAHGTVNNADLVDSFEDFLADETYRQLSAEKYNLGFPSKVKGALSATRRLARRLVRKKKFSRFFDYGSRAISVGTGIPLPNSDIADAIVKKSYLPPIMDLTDPISAARQAWIGSGSERIEALSIVAPLLNRRRISFPLEIEFSEGRLVVVYNFFDFTGMYHLNGLPEPDDHDLQKFFGHFFAVNLDPPVECSLHDKLLSTKAVTVEWLGEEVRFEVTACCANAAKLALGAMLAYDKDKDYSEKD
jgi:hypothetical protein